MYSLTSSLSEVLSGVIFSLCKVTKNIIAKSLSLFITCNKHQQEACDVISTGGDNEVRMAMLKGENQTLMGSLQQEFRV
jgi:hypothetical protein